MPPVLCSRLSQARSEEPFPRVHATPPSPPLLSSLLGPGLLTSYLPQHFLPGLMPSFNLCPEQAVGRAGTRHPIPSTQLRAFVLSTPHTVRRKPLAV